tara:strand:- start:345 stop:812 length:468 start_codon:yes stop_codon:yes gene_type:complete
MPGRVQENREIPRIATFDRDTYVRDIARLLVEEVIDIDDDISFRVEQFLGGVIHYLLGRVHDRAEQSREPAKWRGKAPLIPLVNGLLMRQRQNMGDTTELLYEWLESLIRECEVEKYNPIAKTAFTALLRMPPKQVVRVLDFAERSLRIELGLPA